MPKATSRSKRVTKNISRTKRPEDVRDLSHRILQFASRGVLRTKFQQTVSKMIMEFSGCDAVELWVKEHNKYFRCKMERRPHQSFPFEITTLGQNEMGRMISEPNAFAISSAWPKAFWENSEPSRGTKIFLYILPPPSILF